MIGSAGASPSHSLNRRFSVLGWFAVVVGHYYIDRVDRAARGFLDRECGVADYHLLAYAGDLFQLVHDHTTDRIELFVLG